MAHYPLRFGHLWTSCTILLFVIFPPIASLLKAFWIFLIAWAWHITKFLAEFDTVSLFNVLILMKKNHTPYSSHLYSMHHSERQVQSTDTKILCILSWRMRILLTCYCFLEEKWRLDTFWVYLVKLSKYRSRISHILGVETFT